MTFSTVIVPRPDAENKGAPSTLSIAPTDVTGTVYLASPLSTYHTPRYDRMCEHVRNLFPNATVLPARDCGFTRATWLPRWRTMLPTLVAVVFFRDEAGMIGKGVYTEILDADARGLPIWMVDDAGMAHHADDLWYGDPDEADWRAYVSVTTDVEMR